MRDNLNSDNPIPFFDDEIIEANLPGYDSSLVIINEVTNQDTIRAWLSFCMQQSESFDRRYHEVLTEKPKVIEKIQQI